MARHGRAGHGSTEATGETSDPAIDAKVEQLTGEVMSEIDANPEASATVIGEMLAESPKERTAEELRLRYEAAREGRIEAELAERAAFKEIESRIAVKFTTAKARNPKTPAPQITLCGERYQLRKGRGDAGMYLDKLGPVEVIEEF